MSRPPAVRFPASSDPKFLAGAMALGVHVLFALLLVFGLSWQTSQPVPVMVDVWDALPPVRPVAAPEPRVAPEPKPEPKPAPKPEPKPAPKPEPKPVKPPSRPVEETPPPKAPDIALEKKKAEAERLKALKEKQAAEEAARAEEARKAREKLAAEARKRELLRQLEEEEVQRAEAEAARTAQAAAQAAAASKRQAAVSGIVAQHIAMISAKVRGNTRLPANLSGNPEVRCRVQLLPTGEVKSVQITQSSGNPAYDDAVVRAIEKSSPLPLPEDRDARASFVPELSFVHRPK